MDRPHRHSPTTGHAFGPAPGLAVGLGLIASLILGACSPTTPVPTSISTPTSVPSVEPTGDASGGPSTSGPAPQAGQTDTDWGRVWDTLPAAFPVYPGSTPAAEAETGPVSATFALQGSDARTVANWMRTELERAAYSTEALNGPFEDGGFVLDSTGAAGCRIEVAVAPLGGLTTVRVRYGSVCPSP
jgi:hypothetical protein